MLDGENLTLHSLWEDIQKVALRRKKLILLTALSAVSTIYLGLLFVSDRYEARASFLVRLGRENAEVPVTVERGSVFTDSVKKEEANSYIALLTSEPLLLSAIDEIGVDRFFSLGQPPKGLLGSMKYLLKRSVRWSKEQIHELLIYAALSPRLSRRAQVLLLIERNSSALLVKDSNVIELSLRLADPILARDFLTVLTRKYLDRHAEVRQQADSVSQLFEDQAQVSSDRLATLRGQLSRLKAELGVSSVAEQRLQLLEMLKSAELGKQESERELAKLRAGRAALIARREQLPDQFLAFQVLTPSAAATRAKEILAGLHVEKAQALAKYDPGTPPVKRIESQIEEIEALTNHIALQDEGPKTYAPNPVVSHMDLEQEDDQIRIATLEAGIDKGNHQVAQIKVDLEHMDRADTELQKLQLEIKVAENRFLANASKREEARMEEIMDHQRLANVVMLSPPSFSEKPVSPRRLLTVGLGLFVGLCLGLGLSLILEWQNDTIYDAKDLERVCAGTYLGSFGSTRTLQPHAPGKDAGLLWRARKD